MSALAVACFAYAPFDPDWWLAKNVSAHGPLAFGAKVDRLFFLILAITGGVFIITELAMVYVLWRYPQNTEKKAHYTHGSQTLEVVWTIIPAILLVFITVDQMGTWAEHQVPVATARGPDAGRGHRPSVPVGDALPRARRQARAPPTTCPRVNDLHFVKNKPVLDPPRSRRTCCTRSSCPRCGSSRTPCRD